MERPTREEAFALLREFNSSENLIRHALAVESVMRHMARERDHDEDKWGIIGLVHDLDYERFPEQHCHKTAEILRERGWPEDYIHAVQSHGWGLCTEVEPVHEMEKVLYAVDELTGLVTAVALVRPSRSLMDLKPKSVTKKWNDKSFAAGASREIIQKGIDMIGVERSALIAEVITGMRTVAEELGLAGPEA
jgi:putative nucleotidyltransferase with HDIG domain